MTRSALLGIALLGVLLGSPAAAQEAGKTYRVGILTGRGPAYDRPLVAALLHTLSSGGFQEGKNLAIVYRGAGGNLKRLPELAGELLRAKPDVIVANGPIVVAVMKRATTSVPIVMTRVPDPIELGFVSSIARPGGNITGLGGEGGSEMTGKWVQLLKELVPNLQRIAVAGNDIVAGNANRTVQREMDAARRSARTVGVTTVDVGIRSSGQIDAAFKAIQHAHPDAILVLADPVVSNNAAHIVRNVAAVHLPAIYTNGTMTALGGLMSYNSSETDEWAKAATYVDRILKGAKPADLPVQQSTTYDLVVNLKTARTLGVTIPQSILLQATHVIR